MRRIRSVIYTVLLVIFFTVSCNSIVFAGTFTVRGTLIKEDAPATIGESTETPAALAEARVQVLLRENNDSSESQAEVLLSGRMKSGEISLIGEVDKATTVTISVDAGLEAPLTLDAVIAPGREVSFALLEWPTILAFLGTVNSTKDSSKQFKVFGNLSSINTDLQHATVMARALERDAVGEPISSTWHVLLQNNRFEITGEVTEPRVINIFIYKGINYTQTQAIIEPGAEIEVTSQNDSLKDVFAVSPSGKGKHAMLIDSWQQADEFWATKRAYVAAIESYQKALLDPKTPKVETEVKPPDNESSSNDDDTVEPTVTEEDKDECAKYALQQRRVQRQRPNSPPAITELPEHVKIFRQLNRLRLDPLEALAEQADNAMDALLALELGAFWGEPKRQEVYDRLAQTLDPDIVERRVIHDRNDHARYLNQEEKTFSLLVGTRAPEFALTSFEGTTVELYEVVKEHRHVLVEFWASWCGPCIKALPELKTVYAKRNSEGFEIVSVSVDRTHEPWAKATERHELPWINLAELKETSRDVAQMYGVSYIPKNYLLDNNGCIVSKDVSSFQLERILAEAGENDDSNDRR